jgi:twinkle protein|tara:strand:+ start:1479 stop:3140 length:1662 start_codon:yes stop_codon:yes gene_type:complete
MYDTKAKFVKHIACESCGSSDANSLYEDGNQYCFSCEHFIPSKGKDNMVLNNTRKAPIQGVINNVFSKGEYGHIGRAVKPEVCKKFGVTTSIDGKKHIYPYYDQDKNHVGNKIRNVPKKDFFVEGSTSKAQLFGQHLFNTKGKYITVTEGELDALSIYQMFGMKWPVVSVKHGAPSAHKDCQAELEYLNSFDNVILCFDNDAAGRKAADKVAVLFEPHKCKIVSLDYKDANEYLMAGQAQAFVSKWWDAQEYTPAGIKNLKDLGEDLYKDNECESVAFPWVGMNEKLYGIRTGELVTFTSGAGMGKSSMMRELMHHLMVSTNHNIGVLALEESIRNTAFNIMSVEADARLYIKEVRDTYSKDQLKAWEKDTIGTGRFYAFDHFGSISNDEILNRVRHMIKALDCKWIFLDHLSILVSGQEDMGDERRGIDLLMTKLRSLVEETQIGLLLVSHLRRTTGDRGHEDGREVSLSHLRGSQSIAHLSDSVIALERNQQEQDERLANTTTIRILKNRYTGDTGVATYLNYNKDTGRMSEISNPFETNEEQENPFNIVE